MFSCKDGWNERVKNETRPTVKFPAQPVRTGERLQPCICRRRYNMWEGCLVKI